MFEKRNLHQPFQNWKKTIAGFLVISLYSFLFAQNSEFGLEITAKEGLPSSVIRKVHVDLDGSVWTATDGGLAVFPNFNSAKQKIAKDLSQCQVWDIFQDSKIIVFGSYDSGLYVYNIKSGALISRLNYNQAPRCRAIKTIGNQIFAICSNRILRYKDHHFIEEVKSEELLDKSHFFMDVFSWNHEIYAVGYPNSTFYKRDIMGKWHPTDAINPNHTKYSIIRGMEFKGKLILATDDNHVISLAKDGTLTKQDILPNKQNTWAIWDMKIINEALFFAIGNTQNFDRGMVAKYNPSEKAIYIPQNSNQHFSWSLTYDPVNEGIWTSTIGFGAFFYPQYHRNIYTPFTSENYKRNHEYQIIWQRGIIASNKIGETNWAIQNYTSNLKDVVIIDHWAYLQTETGIFEWDLTSNSSPKSISKDPSVRIFCLNQSLYQVRYYNYIRIFNTINHQWSTLESPLVKNINSVEYNRDFAIAHTENLGYIAILKDSAIPLKINSKTDNRDYNFSVMGKTLIIQNGNLFRYYEVDILGKKLIYRQEYQIYKAFNTINLQWFNISEEGFWCGDQSRAFHLKLNPETPQLNLIGQLYLGKTNEINTPFIFDKHLYITRSNFIQQFPFELKTRQVPDNSFKLTFNHRSPSVFSFPYITKGQNLSFQLTTDNYIVWNHAVLEYNVYSTKGPFSNQFCETQKPFWTNDLEEGLYQASIFVNNHTFCYPIKVENFVYQRFEFWIFMAILLTILGFYFYTIQKEQYALKQEILSNELKVLRSNFNPHFIFNVMNFIQSMIIKGDPKKAIKATTELAQLNRMFLETSNKELITLEEEFSLAKRYMSLEKMRFEADKQFEFSLKFDSILDPSVWFVPPLILQPLLENAIKHGILTFEEKGKIKIFASLISEKEMMIEVSNTGNPKNVKRKKGMGMGIALVEERIHHFNLRFANQKLAQFTKGFEGDNYVCHFIFKRLE